MKSNNIMSRHGELIRQAKEQKIFGVPAGGSLMNNAM